MKKQVGDVVCRCLTCQHVKAEVAEWKWEHVMMNFVTHLPLTSRGHDTVWVIVDRLIKPTHFLVVRMIFTLEKFYRLYI